MQRNKMKKKQWTVYVDLWKMDFFGNVAAFLRQIENQGPWQSNYQVFLLELLIFSYVVT